MPSGRLVSQSLSVTCSMKSVTPILPALPLDSIIALDMFKCSARAIFARASRTDEAVCDAGEPGRPCRYVQIFG